MKSKKEFKERFKNGEFEEDLKNISSPEEFVDFARGLGYDVTLEDISSEELDDDVLSMVAGGKGDTVEYRKEDSLKVDNSGTPADQRKGNKILDMK